MCLFKVLIGSGIKIVDIIIAFIGEYYKQLINRKRKAVIRVFSCENNSQSDLLVLSINCPLIKSSARVSECSS